MKIDIEVYKGQSIQYDDSSDKFICDITVEDRNKSTKRQSLNDVRKEIDTFIKLNVGFKPFKVFTKDAWSGIETKEVTAIRSDGKFVVKNSYNSDHVKYLDMMNKYGEYNVDIEQQYKEARKEFDKASEIYDKRKEELKRQIKPLDISKYEYIINQ